MRERGVTLLLALAALAAFYGMWLRPTPSLDPDSDAARPTTAERRGNGYAALFEWLARSGIDARSFRDRYTGLTELEIAPRGNLLILSLPGLEVFRNDEFGALDAWVRRGNTLLICAALVDQPGWGAGRSSSTVVEIESLTGVEFETLAARAQRLDRTPLAQRVAEADARDAREEEREEETGSLLGAEQRVLEVPERIELLPTGPHALLRGVRRLGLETDYAAEEWSLRMPYDSFLLTLARAGNGEGVIFEQRLGNGRILLSAGGSLFTNRALGGDDNARLFGNIVAAVVAPGGTVLFDDLRQGLSANYDPARFFSDPRLLRTVFIVLALWLVWVLGSTRLRPPVEAAHDPSEAELVRQAGNLVARAVRPHQTARALFDDFFRQVARVARGAGIPLSAERGELWHWLERHAAILPQELDQLKAWYAEAHAERKPPLTSLQNLLDNLARRIHT
jgi:hypothetical protein